MNRRQFLINLAAAVAGGVAGGASFGQTRLSESAAPVDARLVVDAQSLGAQIPDNYTGLSYELAELTDPDFFSAANKQLVALFRQLSAGGVLRLGGNSSESCWFKANASTTAPVVRPPPGPLSENWMPHDLFEISPRAVDRLADFLGATGWQVIYGLNLGHSSPERAAAEARYVAHAVGSRLLFFQIGNEPDFYNRPNNETRPPNWGFADYLAEWTRYARAIASEVPDARFGGPDVGASSDWIAPFIAGATKAIGSRLVAVTGHYYAEGPPDNPAVTVSRLLRRNPAVARRAKTIAEDAARHGLLYRMTEGNSCYRGGKPGMSDAFASALWGADYMLCLAAAGCAGVNFHGGSPDMLRKSLGDHMPGSLQQPSPGSGAFYTPIAGESAREFSARPIYYGMFLANYFAGARLVASNFSNAGDHATAYAARHGSALLVAVFNKSDSNNMRIRLSAAGFHRRCTVLRLVAPALDSITGVTFAGSEISPDHLWSAARIESLTSTSDFYTLNVPRASAALAILE